MSPFVLCAACGCHVFKGTPYCPQCSVAIPRSGPIGRTVAAIAMGLSTTVADLRFVKPLDSELIRKLMATHEVVVTVEEASIGGLGAHVLTLASDEGLLDSGLKIRTMRLPDLFQEHEAPDKQYDEARLNAPHIVETVLKALRRNDIGADAGAIA